MKDWRLGLRGKVGLGLGIRGRGTGVVSVCSTCPARCMCAFKDCRMAQFPWCLAADKRLPPKASRRSSPALMHRQFNWAPWEKCQSKASAWLSFHGLSSLSQLQSRPGALGGWDITLILSDVTKVNTGSVTQLPTLENLTDVYYNNI